MSDNNLAKRYSVALINLLEKNNKLTLDQALQDLQKAQQITADSPELLRLFDSVQHSRQQKINVYQEVFKDFKFMPLVDNLLQLLIYKNRFFILPSLCEQLQTKLQEINLEKVVEVFTAKPLSSALQKKLIDGLNDKSKYKFRLKTKIDSKIYGGIIVRLGEKEYDFSIAGQLQTLQEQIKDQLASY